MTAVLTALGHRWEGEVARLLESSREVQIARRCADLPDLVATAAAGLGSVALVSDDLRGLDLTTVARLRDAGVHVVGLSVDEEGERHLRQLGIASVVVVGSDLATYEAALSRHEAGAGGETAGSAGGDSGPGSELDGLAELERREGLHELGGADPRVNGSRVNGASASSATPGGMPGPASPSLRGPTSSEPEEPAEPGRIVAVWGPAGAPGRTTVAVNLAAELAALGVPTVLVDADTYGGSIAQALSLLDEAPGLAAATRSADQGSLDLPALARLAPEVTRGLRVLTGIPKAERWTEIRPGPLERVLTLARSLAQVVVVDCGFSLEDDEELSYDTQAPRRNAATLTTLELADELLAVGGCDPVSLQRLVRGLQELGTVRSPSPRVVVNRVRSSAVGSRPEQRVREALLRFAGVDDLSFVPDDPAALDGAMLEGRVLAECAPQSPARTALRTLAAHVGRVPATTRRGARGRRR